MEDKKQKTEKSKKGHGYGSSPLNITELAKSTTSWDGSNLPEYPKG